MKISLVILTLNEIVGVKALIQQIPYNKIDEVFAVDGGSTDGTVELLEKNGITVHTQSEKGRGEAFREAFRQSTCDACLFFSPDGNEDPLDIIKFRDYLENSSDIVIATRMVDGAYNEEDDQILKWRKWVNNIFNLMANITWNRNQAFVTDTINGYRAITKTAWKLINLDGSGYAVEYQSSIRAFKMGLKISEFPTHEAPRLDKRQGSPSLSTGCEFIKIYFKEVICGKDWK